MLYTVMISFCHVVVLVCRIKYLAECVRKEDIAFYEEYATAMR
jgi:hypothetical protein